MRAKGRSPTSAMAPPASIENHEAGQSRSQISMKLPGSEQSQISSRHQSLDERLGPVFQGLFYLVQKLVGHGPVDDPVVVAERDVAHGADGDGVVDHHWALFDCAEAQNAYIGLADHRQAEQTAEDAGIGDGEGAFLDFLGLELFRTRRPGETVEVTLDAEKIFFICVPDDRHEEPPVEGHGDADVYLLVQT